MLGVVNNLSTRLNSHNAGWTLVCKNILERKFHDVVEVLDNRCDYEEYDAIVINEGVNYREGVFNFFGGVQPRQIDALIKLSKYKGKLYSVNNIVDYNALLSKRKELNSLQITFAIPEVIGLCCVTNKMVLGDSHSLSIFRPGYSISRNDGKTLHGFLKNGISSYLHEDTKEIIFYAGNIDIRFHVNRLGGKEAVKDLSLRLYDQLLDLQSNGIKVTLTHLLPIEDESRKIPGTGLYRGYGFYGSKEERTEYVIYFNSLLDRIAKKLNLDVITWDFDYNEGLDFYHMEAKQSVHIRPASYKYIDELS